MVATSASLLEQGGMLGSDTQASSSHFQTIVMRSCCISLAVPSTGTMGFQISVESAYRLAVARLSDTVTGSTLVAALRSLFEYPDRVPTHNILWDARRIDLLDISPAQVQEFRVARTDEHMTGPGCRNRAIFELLYATNRTAGHTVTTTLSPTEAATILQVPPPVIDS